MSRSTTPTALTHIRYRAPQDTGVNGGGRHLHRQHLPGETVALLDDPKVSFDPRNFAEDDYRR
jgi:hypothetical protein